MWKFLAAIGALVFGYLAYTAAYMGGVDQVTVGLGLLALVCVLVVTSKGGSKSAKKAKAKANA